MSLIVFGINSFLTRKILVVLLLILLSGVILEIWTVNRLASFGSQLNRIEHSKQRIILDNQLLRAQIAERSSLNKASNEAVSLGFKEVSVQYLSPTRLALSH